MPRPKSSADWSRAAGAVSTTLTAFLVLGLLAGLTAGLGPLEARAAKVTGIKPPTVTIAWPTWQAPDGTVTTWLDESFQEQILQRATAAIDPGEGPTGAFQRDTLMAIAESMRTSGWFEGTPVITRRAEGEIHVAGQWRIPAAVVRNGSKDQLVSWSAMPMPVEYPAAEFARSRGQTVLVGVAAAPPTDAAGLRDFTAPWPGEDLRAGLELLALLSKQTWSAQVAAIDVAGFNAVRELAIITRRGGRVVWGGRPDEPRLGDIATAAKIAHLDQFNRSFGSIDAGRTHVEIWGVQPLEINVSASRQAP